MYNTPGGDPLYNNRKSSPKLSPERTACQQHRQSLVTTFKPLRKNFLLGNLKR